MQHRHSEHQHHSISRTRHLLSRLAGGLLSTICVELCVGFSWELTLKTGSLVRAQASAEPEPGHWARWSPSNSAPSGKQTAPTPSTRCETRARSSAPEPALAKSRDTFSRGLDTVYLFRAAKK